MSRIRRMVAASAVAAVMLLSGAFAPAADAVIRRPERQLARLVNNYRDDHGENRLNHKSNLHRVAERNSKKMAESGQISHTDLDDVPCNGRKGEVAGKGSSVRDAFNNLKASAPHRQIILRSYWQKMGAGVAEGENDDFTYVTVVFCD